MPMPGVHNIEAYYGSELSLSYTYKDSSGSAVNLGSSDVKFTVRDSAADPKTSLGLTEGSGVTVTNASAGQFTVTATADQISALGRRGKRITSVYELSVTTGSSVEVIVRGTFSVGSGE